MLKSFKRGWLDKEGFAILASAVCILGLAIAGSVGLRIIEARRPTPERLFAQRLLPKGREPIGAITSWEELRNRRCCVELKAGQVCTLDSLLEKDPQFRAGPTWPGTKEVPPPSPGRSHGP